MSVAADLNADQGQTAESAEGGHAEAAAERPVVSECESVAGAVPGTSGATLLMDRSELCTVNEEGGVTSGAVLMESSSMMVESLSDNGAAGSQEDSCEFGVSQVESCSRSQVCSQESAQVDQPIYSLEEINSFLDKTFGKQVDVKDFFPDFEKFVRSVALLQKTVGLDLLNEKKRFRLKRHITVARREKERKSSCHL